MVCHCAGPSANGTTEPVLQNGTHAATDTSPLLGQRFVPPSPATTSGRELQGKQHTTAWAVRGGVEDLAGEFERLRPKMAHHFPFELDNFQKEAIVHLERVKLSCLLTISLWKTSRRWHDHALTCMLRRAAQLWHTFLGAYMHAFMHACVTDNHQNLQEDSTGFKDVYGCLLVCMRDW